MPSLASLEKKIDSLRAELLAALAGMAPKNDDRDPSIAGFCARHGISRSTYFNLRRAGKGPRETAATDKRRIITEEAETEWIAARDAAATEIAARRSRAAG